MVTDDGDLEAMMRAARTLDAEIASAAALVGGSLVGVEEGVPRISSLISFVFAIENAVSPSFLQ